MQLDMDFHARRTDPPTSHQAASKVKHFAGEHHKLILGALALKDGQEPHEIAQMTGLDYHAVQRRVSELARAGQILADGERSGCRVWWLA